MVEEAAAVAAEVDEPEEQEDSEAAVQVAEEPVQEGNSDEYENQSPFLAPYLLSFLKSTQYFNSTGLSSLSIWPQCCKLSNL